MSKCGDCIHFGRCSWLIQAQAHWVMCDWEPSKFKDKTEKHNYILRSGGRMAKMFATQGQIDRINVTREHKDSKWELEDGTDTGMVHSQRKGLPRKRRAKQE